MCRLAAFPPGTPQEQAHEIVADFVRGNDDGVGTAHVKDGEFILKKYPYSYQEAVTKKDDLFSHMPYDGWTLAHVRYATHGGNTIPNTHPIIRGDIVGVHNGVFGNTDIVRIALDGAVKWQGETDTEVALYLLNKLGRDEFYKAFSKGYGGVFLTLNRKGELDCSKLGGDMKFQLVTGNKYIVASQFPHRYRETSTEYGCYGFKADGTPRDWTPKAEKKNSERYERGDIHQGGVYLRGRWFRSFDEARQCQQGGCGAMVTNTVPPPTHTADDETKTLLLITKDGVTEKKKPLTPPALWDWKTESEILEYMRAMA